MPPKGVQLRRASHQLPMELVQRNSDLDVLITLAGDSVANRTYGFESTAKIVRRVLRQNCSSYSPSAVHAHDVLCGSGEKDGSPTLGPSCFKCRASQFSRSGFFTGDTNETVHTVISPVVVVQSETMLDDFIKSLEEAV